MPIAARSAIHPITSCCPRPTDSRVAPAALAPSKGSAIPGPMSGTSPRLLPTSVMLPRIPLPASSSCRPRPANPATNPWTATAAQIDSARSPRARRSPVTCAARRPAKSEYSLMPPTLPWGAAPALGRGRRCCGFLRARARPDLRQEVLVESQVAVDLGVEARADQVALLHRDDTAVGDRGERACRRTDRLHHRSADEDRVNGLASELGDLDVGLERLVLRPERVPPHDDVEPAERPLARNRVEERVGEHDQPGAGAVHRQAVLDARLQRLREAERPGELVHHGRLAAGDHEAVDLLEVLGTAHERHARAQDPEDPGVLTEVALQREDAHPRTGCALGALRLVAKGHQPRSASRCGAARSPTLMPTIASPSPRDTSAITAGSS